MALPLLEFPTRHTIGGWIPDNYLKNKFLRHVTITTLILGFSLGISLLFPSSSGNVLVVTGATGVCMVSYLIPIVNHLLLHYNRSKFQKEALARTVPGSSDSSKHDVLPETDMEDNKIVWNQPFEYRRSRKHPFWSVIIEYSRDVFLPIVVLGVGVFCSVASLSTLGQN